MCFFVGRSCSIHTTNYLPRKSKSTKLCPFVVGNSCSMDHPKDQPLCLVLDFQGYSWVVHLPKQTWNLKMDPWKRRFLLETTISKFHVNFWGCISICLFQLLRPILRWTPRRPDRPGRVFFKPSLVHEFLVGIKTLDIQNPPIINGFFRFP